MDQVQLHFEKLFGPEFGHGKAFDLAPLAATLKALGDPQDKLRFPVQVAGTNGKGSTIAFMRAIAEAAGLRVHAFTKPHLLSLNERFLVQGKVAEDAALIAAADRVWSASNPPSYPLTQFDAQVATAFLMFGETPGDVCLIETGMGGRDDSTNLIGKAAATLIAPIALDHQDALGASLAEIAAHKAGILKSGAPAIVARQGDAARKIIQARAKDVGAQLHIQGEDWDAYPAHGRLIVQLENEALDLPLPALAGAHQFDNAGLGVAALKYANAPIPNEAFAVGLAEARLSGRLQPLMRGALSAPIRAQGGEVWVDAGHNGHAALALARSLSAMNAKRKATNIAIVAMRARKDAGSFITALAGAVDRIIATPLGEAHIAPTMLAEIARASGADAATAPSLGAAMQSAAQWHAPRVLICGSFLLAGEALSAERS